jgi:hypothetical protein
MDENMVAHFRSRYSELDIDGLVELHQRRDSLVEEACFALDEVLLQRGIAGSMLTRYASGPTESSPVATRRNWKVMAVQLVVILISTFLASALAQILPRWLSVLLLIGLFAWWLFSKRTHRKG